MSCLVWCRPAAVLRGQAGEDGGQDGGQHTRAHRNLAQRVDGEREIDTNRLVEEKASGQVERCRVAQLQQWALQAIM